MVLPTLPSQLDPLRTFTTTDLKPQSKAENCRQTPLWRFPWIKLLQKGQSMQELCHSFPVCWRSWNVSSTEMLSWARRVEAVDTKAVLMPCLCLAFKQLCYSSSVKGEISSALALPVHLIARDDNCKLLMLFLSSPTQFCLPTSLFFFSQKANPKIFLQLGVPYEVSHELSQGWEIPWEHSHSGLGCCSVCNSS